MVVPSRSRRRRRRRSRVCKLLGIGNSYPAGRPFSDTFTVLECASCYAYRGILRTAIAAIPIYGAAHIDSFTLASELVCLAIAVSMHSQQAIGSYSYSDPGCSGYLSRSNK